LHVGLYKAAEQRHTCPPLGGLVVKSNKRDQEAPAG